MRLRCLGCGGIYGELRADDVAYRHVCPPRVMVRVQRNGSTLLLPLADVRATDTIRVLRNGIPQVVLAAALQAGDERIDDRLQRRPAGVHRDERPQGAARVRPTARRRLGPIADEGAGVMDLP